MTTNYWGFPSSQFEPTSLYALFLLSTVLYFSSSQPFWKCHQIWLPSIFCILPPRSPGSCWPLSIWHQINLTRKISFYTICHRRLCTQLWWPEQEIDSQERAKAQGLRSLETSFGMLYTSGWRTSRSINFLCRKMVSSVLATLCTRWRRQQQRTPWIPWPTIRPFWSSLPFQPKRPLYQIVHYPYTSEWIRSRLCWFSFQAPRLFAFCCYFYTCMDRSDESLRWVHLVLLTFREKNP